MNTMALMQNSANFYSAVKSIIKTSCFVDFGIVLEVVSKGVVKVGISTATSSKDVRVVTCTLISPVAKSFALDIIPQKDDKVLVVYPRTFSTNMFDLNNNDVIIDNKAHGYDATCGLAILMNQYREDDYENTFSYNEGNFLLKTPVTELSIDNEGNTIYTSNDVITVSLDKDGNVSLENPETTVSLDKDGNVSLENPKISTSLDKNGNISIKNDKITAELKNDGSMSLNCTTAEISIDTSGNITLNAKGGKLALENNLSSVYKVINNILTKLNSGTVATAGSPASHNMLPAQFTPEVVELNKILKS